MVGDLGAVLSHPRRIDYTPPCYDMKIISHRVVGSDDLSMGYNAFHLEGLEVCLHLLNWVPADYLHDYKLIT